VAHKPFLALSQDALCSKMTKPACLIDVKARLNRDALKEAGVAVWRL